MFSATPNPEMALPGMGLDMEMKEDPDEHCHLPPSGWCSWSFRRWHVFLLTFALFTRAGKMAHLVEWFIPKLKDPGLDRQHQCEKPGTLSQSWNPSTGKGEFTGSVGLAVHRL